MNVKRFLAAVMLAVLMCPASWADVAVDAVNFPDTYFRGYVRRNFDKDNNGVLSDGEIAAVKYIAVGGYGTIEYKQNASGGGAASYTSRYHIKSLKGIEYFTALEVLDCSFNWLETLDLSGLPSLVYLNCAFNGLKTLNVRDNTALKVLWCCINNITALDLSGNTELQELYCYNNPLTTLDVSHNSKLGVLFCSGCGLTALDISNNPLLWSLSCGKNTIRTLDISNNSALVELYCFRNSISQINTDKMNELLRLSFTENSRIGTIKTANCPGLQALDCGKSYIVSIDTSTNTNLTELYVNDTPVKDIDLSANTALISLDCSDTDIKTLDLGNNPSLSSLEYSWKYIKALNITTSDSGGYQTDMREYVGGNLDRIEEISAYRFARYEYAGAASTPDYTVYVDYDRAEGIAYFSEMPHYIIYGYNTGYTGSAPQDKVARTISVAMELPGSFIYIPPGPDEPGHEEPTPGDKPGEPQETPEPGEQPKTLSFSFVSHVVSTDESPYFYSVSTASIPEVSIPEVPEKPDDPDPGKPDDEAGHIRLSSGNPEPEPHNPDDQHGGGGGGCSSFAGMSALVCAVSLMSRRSRKKPEKTKILATLLMAAVLSTPAQAQVHTSDYALPIEYTVYDIAGSWTTDFELTAEMTDKILDEWDRSAVFAAVNEDVRKYTPSGSWNVLPADLYHLSQTGEYGGVVLPVMSSGSSSNTIYVIKCTFGTDIQPGELIAVHGFEVDDDYSEAVYGEDKSYMTRYVVLDEGCNRVAKVPESRTVYVAVQFMPEYVNTGIVTAVRGEYVEEDDPLDRLDPAVAQKIADQLGINIADLKYLTRSNMGRPLAPTEAMKEYVKNDGHEIIADLPTVSVDESGQYVIRVTLSAEAWEVLKNSNVGDYKFYALNDSELGERQLQASFISGLLGTWELFTVSGEKMDTFGVREFFMVGFLDSGQPFSLYVAKLILALFSGGATGCNTGMFTGVLALAVMLLSRKR